MAIETQPTQQGDTLPPDPARREKRRTIRRRRRLRSIAKFFITLGLLTIGFVVYEYWGTTYLAQRAQNSLRNTVSAKGFVQYSIQGAAPEQQPGVAKPQGRPIPRSALGFLKIPRMHLDMIFVQGSDRASLDIGPGHYADTPLPGQGGNVGIAGHRTTYLHPFWSLNEMRKGDLIVIETTHGTFQYRVLWVRIVPPDDRKVLAPTVKPSLTLTTCNPRFSAAQRLIVRAEQVSGPGLNAPIPGTNA